MIDENAAREVVARKLGPEPFELRDFEQGWRVAQPHLAGRVRGAGTLVVERATGKLLLFASGLPPRVIHESFDEVRAEAVDVSDDESSDDR